MSTIDLKTSKVIISHEKEEEYDIPLDISDLIKICKEYSVLGHQIQNQVDIILEIGVEQSITTGMINQSAVPHIKNFLQQITENAYFGDATGQAQECIFLIEKYQKNTEIHTMLN